MINARSETAAEKPAFRAAMRSRRCLIPADGFFEWRKEGKQKRPMYFCRYAPHLSYQLNSFSDASTNHRNRN